MFNNITSANANAILRVAELYPAGIVLQNYATDQAITQDDDQIAETRMGIDGKMSAGYKPSIKIVNITLEPGSSSIVLLNDVYIASQTNLRPYNMELLINLPALDTTYTYTNGIMYSFKILPDINNVLQPVTCTIHFEKVTAA